MKKLLVIMIFLIIGCENVESLKEKKSYKLKCWNPVGEVIIEKEFVNAYCSQGVCRGDTNKDDELYSNASCIITRIEK